MTRTRALSLFLLTTLALAWPITSTAQSTANASAQAAQAPEDDPDRDLNLAQPDFSLVNLRTTLRLPRFKSAFRVTHRFGRSLGQGDFGDLAEDLFGLDSGGLIGLEYRFGLMRGWQVGFLRTSDRTINFFTQYSVMNQKSGSPVGIDAVATIDGTNNMRDSYSPALGAVISREIGDRAAIYLQPMWVNNTNTLPSSLADHNDTFFVGLGARVRIRPTVYLVGEVSPRAGNSNSPGAHHGSFGIEKRAGGHTFQLNFSNGLGNTPGQLARGGASSDDWYIGFNISRKFF
jgi:hypothetical protein